MGLFSRFKKKTPSEKAGRFAKQIKEKKVSETGKELTPEEIAYRKGYLGARSDSAEVYKANKRKETHNEIKALTEKAKTAKKKADKDKIAKEIEVQKALLEKFKAKPKYKPPAKPKPTADDPF